MRKRTKIVIACLVVALVVILGAPQLLSSTVVRERIEQQVSELTGHSLSLGSGGRVSLSPYLAATYKDAVLTSKDGSNRVLFRAEKMQARLSLFSIFGGEARFTEILLVRPKFTLSRKDFLRFVRSDELSSTQNVSAVSLGQLELKDAILELENDGGDEVKAVTGLNGSISWPTTADTFDAHLTGIWNGESVSLSANVSNLIELVRGGLSDITLSADSSPATLAFEGNSSIKDGVLASGRLETSSPSLDRVASWTGLPLRSLSLARITSLDGDVVLDGNKLDVSNAQLVLGENSATGRLRFERLETDLIRLTGTLAADALTISELPELAGNRISLDTNATRASDPFSDLELDLRLSANRVDLPSLGLDDVAATVLIKDSVATIDVGRANALEGLVTGSITYGRPKDRTHLDADIHLKGAQLQALSALVGQQSIAFAGSGDLSINISSNVPQGQNPFHFINGDGAFKSENGTLVGLDFGAFSEDDYDSVDNGAAIPKGETAFETLSVDWEVANGVVFVRQARLKQGDMSVDVLGRADIARNAVALTGKTIRKISVEDESSIDRFVAKPFFVGGSPTNPLFIALPPSNQPRGAPDAVPQPAAE